ncbi:IAA-alanine resistance protein 1-like [Melia azedarach]|uniref:IAA-alanine resistance protein 1-like n=2 Tax=Melia azedarach TaxID=155640 RepID=A0ACC1XFC2_MELAZ|nr:IAA-alanine resistance protein 1-like [Melia azedarach]KAJ4710167.1 IAA-alanine resistance protein 1-like [Melia azedarach]
MFPCNKRILLGFVWVLVFGLCLDLGFGSGSGSCATPVHGEKHGHHHHQCDHGHHHHDHGHEEKKMLLPEELAEEEDMRLYGFGPYHDHDNHNHHHNHGGDSLLSGLALWVNALGCSLLVSLASLICLIILPVIFIQGKPSKAVVDSLALFGAGAMLGDAFLHQLPHAFGGEHSHSHDHHEDRAHHAHVGHGHPHSHSHSLQDLSVGISVLAGIVLFLLVEKLVRYVDENSGEANSWGHAHHHHHKSSKKLKDDDDLCGKMPSQSSSGTEGKVSDEVSKDSLNGDNLAQDETLIRRRKTSSGAGDDKSDVNAADGSLNDIKSSEKKEHVQPASNLVFGYLNLFSDGVHNFTDGMALGSAFLLYGSVGGWSRTVFLLAHELPQEVGDFGILVRSGFSVSKALFFNFLSALVALAGTAMALLLGKDPGQSSLIEGFTAGGFIYIAVAGVLAEMNNSSHSTLKSTAVQLTSLILGMSVALCISLVE